MGIQRRAFVGMAGVAVAGALAGCTASGEDGEAAPEISGETLSLATTTSTYVTGLLDALNAPFEERYGVAVHTVPQGTGAAIETGRNGDADVLIVHARSLEDEFIREGYGVNRRDLMINDFVVAGAPDDPAGISGTEDVLAAFERIADTESTFVSRGDGSGTHTRERELWAASAVADEAYGSWYRDAGDGMGPILYQTDEVGGYTLADRGTYLSMRSELDLELHVEGPVEGGTEALANPYGIVVVNPAIYEGVAYDLAMAYVGYVTGPEGQEIVEEFTVDGDPLFVPAGLTEESNFEQHLPEDWSESDEGDSTGSD